MGPEPGNRFSRLRPTSRLPRHPVVHKLDRRKVVPVLRRGFRDCPLDKFELKQLSPDFVTWSVPMETARLPASATRAIAPVVAQRGPAV